MNGWGALLRLNRFRHTLIMGALRLMGSGSILFKPRSSDMTVSGRPECRHHGNDLEVADAWQKLGKAPEEQRGENVCIILPPDPASTCCHNSY